jgi:hypothetical protein
LSFKLLIFRFFFALTCQSTHAHAHASTHTHGSATAVLHGAKTESQSLEAEPRAPHRCRWAGSAGSWGPQTRQLRTHDTTRQGVEFT